MITNDEWFRGNCFHSLKITSMENISSYIIDKNITGFKNIILYFENIAM